MTPDGEGQRRKERGEACECKQRQGAGRLGQLPRRGARGRGGLRRRWCRLCRRGRRRRRRSGRGRAGTATGSGFGKGRVDFLLGQDPGWLRRDDGGGQLVIGTEV
jgi:hypothetical protein